jgi:RHH-type proline utilization regulon transcriptional repressor/proline dehydrogenase/delta 1-pyrroline-5-carboxylate dehydrogenase
LASDHALLRLAQEWQIKARWGAWGPAGGEIERAARAIKSYLHHMQREFSQENDYFRLRGQDNLLRYLPIGPLTIRLHPADSLFETLARIAAASICGCSGDVSVPPEMDNHVTAFLAHQEGRHLLGNFQLRIEDDDGLIESMAHLERIRYAAPDRVPAAVRTAADRLGFYLACEPVLAEGRIELLWYLRNQSICDNYHRYGNLGERTLV